MSDVDIGNILKKSFHMVFHDIGYIATYSVPLIGMLLTLLLMDFLWINPILITNPSAFDLSDFILAVGIYTLIVLILSILSSIAVAIKVDREKRGTHISASNALREAMSHILSAIGATIISGIVVAGPLLSGVILIFYGLISENFVLAGMGALIMVITIIPFIYALLRLSLYIPACALDNLSAIECLKKSWHVTKGNVILLFVTFLIISVIAIPFSLLNNVFPQYQIGSLLTTLIVGPISGVTITLIYRDLTGKTEEKPSDFTSTSFETEHNPF